MKTLFSFSIVIAFILCGCFSTPQIIKHRNALHYQSKFDFFQLPADEQIIENSYTSFTTKKTDGSFMTRGFYGTVLTGTSNFSDSRLKIKHGISQQFDLNNGKLIQKEEYVNDLLEGDQITYYKSGKEKSVIPFSKDMKNGKAYEYYESGEIEVAYVYKDNEEIEPRVYYYKNGTKKLILDIEPEKQKIDDSPLNKFDVFDAKFEMFDSMANKICGGTYENGKLIESNCDEEILKDKDLNTPDLDEEMPQFPGGDIELLKFYGTNIQYPQIAKENDVQGIVVIGFNIYEDGTAKDFEIIRGIDPSIAEEALRISKQLPKWTPGKVNGKPVKVAFKMPVRFKLE